MTRRQLWVILPTAALLVLCLLVPPWVDARSNSYVRTRQPVGWRPIFAPPAAQMGNVSVDLERLGLEVGGIAVAAAVAWLLVSTPRLPRRGPSFS